MPMFPKKWLCKAMCLLDILIAPLSFYFMCPHEVCDSNVFLRLLVEFIGLLWCLNIIVFVYGIFMRVFTENYNPTPDKEWLALHFLLMFGVVLLGFIVNQWIIASFLICYVGISAICAIYIVKKIDYTSEEILETDNEQRRLIETM